MIEAIFEKLLKISQKEGADFELTLGQAESFSASFQEKKLHKYQIENSQAAGIRVIKGHGSGFARTENISDEAMVASFYEALQSAAELEKFSSKNQDPDEVYFTQERVQVDGLRGDLNLSIEEKIKIAEELERAALAKDQRIKNVPYSGYSENLSKTYLYNSKGLQRSSEATTVTAYSYSLAKNGEDAKSGYEAFYSRSNTGIDAQKIAEQGAEKALSLLGAKTIASGKYAVVLENDVFSDLLGFLVSHLSAEKVKEGTSLFLNKKNQQVLSKKLSIEDNPFDINLMGARSYDAEGVPSKVTKLFTEGVLNTFLTNTRLSRQMKLPLTGHAIRSGAQLGVAPSNIIVAPGLSSFESLLSSSSTVFLVTNIDALHSGFRGATLDFSLPASGFLYQSGKMLQPVHDVVISGNLLSALSGDLELSNRMSEPAGNIKTPDVLIPELSVAGAN